MDKDGEDMMARTEVTVLNIKDSNSGSVKPIPVPQKGIDREEYATRTTLKFLRWLG